MEVTLMEGGIARLQNPNFLFRLSEFAGLAQLRSLWTWVALVAIAAIAALGGVVRRARIVILRLLGRGFPTRSLPESLNHIIPTFSNDDDDDDEDSDYETETYSSCSSSHEMEDEEDVDDDLRREGCRFDCSEEEEWGSDQRLAEMVSGKGVVKTWEDDRFRAEVGFLRTDDLVAFWDRSKDELIRSFLASRGEDIPAVCVSSPGLVLSSGKENDLRVWDARVGSSAPAMIADWQKPGARRRVRGIGTRGGVGKEVCLVASEGGAAGVVDLRNSKLGLAAAAGDTGGAFWSSSAVASWCRNATEFFPLLSPRK